ncbi:MAG: type VI secretion system amidase immunity protein Tai4 [Azoarcus sp.]|jgi:hypothetical protein|nr:type VI secretion system amidase immunity protein Tai4 [Azoarcus sp.]
MKQALIHTLPLIFMLSTLTCHANNDRIIGPQAAARTYAQNYKDIVLARCVATAYEKDRPELAMDVQGSAIALGDWTYYERGKSYDAINAIVSRYLARHYYLNPSFKSDDLQGGRFHFHFLKCLDLYHSEELETQVKQFVGNPTRTYRQDKSPPINTK